MEKSKELYEVIINGCVYVPKYKNLYEPTLRPQLRPQLKSQFAPEEIIINNIVYVQKGYEEY